MSEDKTLSAEDIFKEFKEHSISEFFRKNSQMLGYSGKVRSLTTVVHEYLTNSLDACEEAGILPELSIEIKELAENKYSIKAGDNGPGIPSNLIGKALASVLSGTKFHRYIQQRGQQGIGASGCTLFAQITTGKPIHVISGTGKSSYECDITLDIKSNKPIIENLVKKDEPFRGLVVYGEFGETKYENSDHGVYEYLKRTALSNPHASIRLVEPNGKEILFPRSSETLPKRPKLIKPHPLGISTNDLLEFAHKSTVSRKLSSFLMETFSRVTQNKIDELKAIDKEINFDEDPKKLSWGEAERLVKAFKLVKWIAPELDSLSTIGEEQIKVAIKNILNPQFMSVIERRPKVFRGGIPFVVEAGIAYGGNAGRQNTEGTVGGTLLRFANKVPLLFDGPNCAITEAVKNIQWKRYSISNFEEEPISVFVNVSSVYIPYSGVGKQAIAQEDEIVEEIKLAVQDSCRNLQRYISGVKSMEIQESRYKTIMRYVSQLAMDIGDITNVKREEIEVLLKSLIENKYSKLFTDDLPKENAESPAPVEQEE